MEIFGCKTGRTYTGCPKKEGECEYRLVEQEELEKKSSKRVKREMTMDRDLHVESEGSRGYTPGR